MGWPLVCPALPLCPQASGPFGQVGRERKRAGGACTVLNSWVKSSLQGQRSGRCRVRQRAERARRVGHGTGAQALDAAHDQSGGDLLFFRLGSESGVEDLGYLGVGDPALALLVPDRRCRPSRRAAGRAPRPARADRTARPAAPPASARRTRSGSDHGTRMRPPPRHGTIASRKCLADRA